MKKITWIIILLSVSVSGYSGGNEFYYENAVYKEDIKTVQLFREGFELSNPLLYLGEDANLLLKFDDLSGKVKDYYYTIIHCDAGWNESMLIQNDYLEGFTEYPVDDYAMSFNTTFKYVNYRLQIPNENIQLKLSGNYVVLVYEDNDKENLVLTRRFSVVEDLTRVEATVRRATLDAFKGENHEIDFSVYHESYMIDNPLQDVKVVITQNNRWDNAKTGLKPLFIREDVLIYDYNQENVFKAGNEFRYFDIRSLKNFGEGVFSIDFLRPYYHYTLNPSEPRAGKRYFPDQEMNGDFAIESQDRIVDDYDLECDYVFVHFLLNLESILTGGTINVFGALSNWNANKSNEMSWNFEKGCYELTLLLKQGYYNYQYAWVEDGSWVADLVNIEGSYWETNNDYQVFVYHRGTNSRYDRLIGYEQVSLR